MTTLDGDAPSPTFRSIAAGIAAAILILLAIFNLPMLVKGLGAVLGFLPGKIGLLQVVKPGEVITVDLSISPSVVKITKAGDFALYTNNYDLLVINDAVVEAESEPWLTIESEKQEEIQVHLISRGMAWYDTIYAKGRPVATFSIETPGSYTITHPTRYDTASIVPNYVTGHENWITFIYIAELAILMYLIWDIRGALRERKAKARQQTI